MLVRNKEKAKRKRGTIGVQIDRRHLSETALIIFGANLFIPAPNSENLVTACFA